MYEKLFSSDLKKSLLISTNLIMENEVFFEMFWYYFVLILLWKIESFLECFSIIFENWWEIN